MLGKKIFKIFINIFFGKSNLADNIIKNDLASVLTVFQNVAIGYGIYITINKIIWNSIFIWYAHEQVYMLMLSELPLWAPTNFADLPVWLQYLWVHPLDYSDFIRLFFDLAREMPEVPLNEFTLEQLYDFASKVMPPEQFKKWVWYSRDVFNEDFFFRKSLPPELKRFYPIHK